jgi:rare lipoprotein A (peptidoglycan hydrolase)
MGQADPYALARANGIKNPDLLRVGQVLNLADTTGSQTASSATTVASGKPSARVRSPGSVRPMERPEVNSAGATSLTARQAIQAVASRGREQVVVASWYGPQHHGRLMANGRPFDMHADTVAHPSLPLGTRLRLTNPDNGSSVDVKVTDRGPYIRGRNLDLSYGVAKKLGVVKSGVSRILMQKS